MEIGVHNENVQRLDYLFIIPKSKLIERGILASSKLKNGERKHKGLVSICVNIPKEGLNIERFWTHEFFVNPKFDRVAIINDKIKIIRPGDDDKKLSENSLSENSLSENIESETNEEDDFYLSFI